MTRTHSSVALLNPIKLGFDLGGEADVDDSGKVSFITSLTFLPSSRGMKRRCSTVTYLRSTDRAHDGHVRAGPADAFLLQLLYEAGLGEARRGLGEMLIGRDFVQVPADLSPASGSGRLVSFSSRGVMTA